MRNWRRMALLASLIALIGARASAGGGKVLIPKPGQPTSDFYNAAGTGVRVLAEASPAELTHGDWIKLQLTITNLINPGDVEKPSLKALPAFASFQIDESSQLDPKFDPATPGRRVFVYRLRPLSEQVTQIPELAFHFFDPRRIVAPNRPQDRFPRTYSNVVKIVVKPPVELPAAPTPVDVPDFATRLASSDEILAPQWIKPPIWIWLVALIVPPLLAAGWIVAWRKRNPDAARLVQLKRIRAVRVALAAVMAAKDLPPVPMADAIATAMLEYLRDRFLLPPGAFTPAEIAAHLRSTGCPGDRVVRVEALFRECDDRRFAPLGTQQIALAIEADQLIIAMEEPA